MIRRIFTTILLIAVAPCALADRQTDLNAELQPAQKALAAGDYEKAYARYAHFAARNPLAQFALGLFYQNGWGRTADTAEACRRFEKAAHGNIPAAQHFFGDCLAQGIAGPADAKSALAWYRRAAGNGSMISLCSAADLYIKGKGIDKDVQQGLALCTRAAQADSLPAMLKLANYYEKGTDVPQDLAAARYWYQQAAERHSHDAQYRLGIMLSEGQGGAPDPRTALFWLETAASEGYAPAYLPTAILYANADPAAQTGSLAPEHLAKIYLWNSAAKARASDQAQLAEISRIESMLLAVMPPAWKPELDKKVAEHLAKYKR